ncbi:hypothetical protein [Luteibacter sp. RCC_6_2]|uniref:hypothetical protein n=1 Tax=Luteibacter sp. RCC_6_2 TaxID=3239223 RepID=UPI00352311EF
MSNRNALGRDFLVVPAAEYIRMSSPVNQSIVIAAYAQEHGMRAVRRHFGRGRGGLDIGRRMRYND